MKRTILSILAMVLCTNAYVFAQVYGNSGQIIDTTSIYGERQDSLDAAVFVSHQARNYLSKGK